MNWMEELFGVSPDGGSGIAELTLVLGLALVVATAGAAWKVARRPRRSK
jgi:hypothetical protein